MNEVKKICVDCKTAKTPLWRSGPHGPRSLCNACGIKYSKRKMEIRREEEQSSSRSNDCDENQVNDQVLKMGYDYSGNLGSRIFASSLFSSSSSSSSSQLKKQRSSSEDSSNSSSKRNLGEVEQAAVLLMSLSCGSCFA